MPVGRETTIEPPPDRPLDDAVRALYPPFVASAVAEVDAPVSDRHPQEAALVAAAAPARRRQFLAGRACAHAALEVIGRDGGALLRGREREPLWPAGVVGAIAHSDGLAAAVVARAGDAWGVGLDCEPLDPPLDPAVERLVLAPTEPVPGACGHALGPYRTKIAFCAKECVYKALFPRTRWPLSFPDVAVAVDLVAGRWRATVAGRFRLAGVAPRPLHGRFVVTAGHLLAGLSIPPGGPAAPGGAVTG